MNILITGGNGYIAKSILKNLDNSISITRKDFNLTDRHATNTWFKNKYFDVIIHTAIVGGNRLKIDTGDIFYQNIQMFYNLLNNKHCFGKLINFGSGAENGLPNNPYGLSKNIISRIIDSEPHFYNIRIYGVFDENELDTRFIKSNIIRYINKEPLKIHQNKIMDFFYMKDLVTLVKYYISETYLPKNVDCSYNYNHSLHDIAYMINNLSDYKVDREFTGGVLGHDKYAGEYNPIIKNYIGLEQGIKNTYKKILSETN
jgi:GDP-L-fucose synthase|tara:strand:+ start:10729 stop:11502 length:774 start_codon:yes stop_codon:yes gene_type:complete